MQGKKDDKKVYKKFKQIANIFYNEELEVLSVNKEVDIKQINTIEIEPQLIFDKFTGNMKIEFRIGTSKKCKIKDLSEFYDRIINKEYYQYTEKIQFVHVREVFNEKSKKILDFIMKYAETIKTTNLNINKNYKYYGNMIDPSRIVIGKGSLDEIFEILNGEEVKFQKDNKDGFVKFINKNPAIEFVLNKKEKNEYVITPNVEIFKIKTISGKDNKYILKKDKLYKCTKEFETTTLKLLEVFKQNYITEVELGQEELKDLFSIVLPKVKNAIRIEDITKQEIEKYKPKELITKVYLDFNKQGYLLVDVKFCYGDEEFNPLDESIKKKFPRNIIKETENLNMFKKSGFKIDIKDLRFILPEDDQIYEFISNDFQKYIEKFEILATKRFKEKQIKQPKIDNIGIRVENGLLKIDIENLNVDIEEIEEILLKYREKKKFYRLKTGEFV
ncbi:MAG: SNF2 helicase associated domain-containing protein, partial [Clostridia bacterium]